ncbi:hypothetical protein GCM10022206_79290 [Streptomyces chiangmaiensis]
MPLTRRPTNTSNQPRPRIMAAGYDYRSKTMFVHFPRRRGGSAGNSELHLAGSPTTTWMTGAVSAATASAVTKPIIIWSFGKNGRIVRASDRRPFQTPEESTR